MAPVFSAIELELVLMRSHVDRSLGIQICDYDVLQLKLFPLVQMIVYTSSGLIKVSKLVRRFLHVTLFSGFTFYGPERVVESRTSYFRRSLLIFKPLLSLDN